MRLFLAGPLPHSLQADLFAALAAARRAASQARWVRPGQLHLTLVFFGEMEAAELPALVEALRPVGSRHPGLLLGLRGTGCFGRPQKPEVLFAELTGDLPGLRALHADVQGAVAPFVREPNGQAFHPHLTLARAGSRQGDAALSRCQRALREQMLGAFGLERLVLFRSEVAPGGRLYTPLAEFHLGRAAAPAP